jgi:hypothetical protein
VHVVSRCPTGHNRVTRDRIIRQLPADHIVKRSCLESGGSEVRRLVTNNFAAYGPDSAALNWTALSEKESFKSPR